MPDWGETNEKNESSVQESENVVIQENKEIVEKALSGDLAKGLGNTFTASTVSGTVPTEEEADINVTDRSTKLTIPRNDFGSEWAYENEVAVYNAMLRLENIVNTGLFIAPKKKEYEDDKNENHKKLVEAQELFKDRIPMIEEKVSSIVRNRGCYGWAVLKKTISGIDITDLIELDPKECTPVRDSKTGKLGGKIGVGLDPDRQNAEIALIQKGKIAKYSSDGTINYEDEMFYFDNDEIMVFPMKDRGKFIGTSPIKRILRLVEIKKSMENVSELIVRRFGPQIKVIVGNKDYNMSNAEIPQSYLRDSDGNAVDKATARTSYKKKMFNDIAKNVKKWADGDTLVQMVEFGIDIETFNPSSNSFDYARYIDMFANYIKIGILGTYLQGRVDITSSVMQTKLMRDLRDLAERERKRILAVFNEEYVKVILKAKGFKEDFVHLEFNPIDQEDKEKEALIEEIKSNAILNYARAGMKVPEGVQEKMDLLLEESQIINQRESQRKIKETIKSKGEGDTSEAKKLELQEANKNR